MFVLMDDAGKVICYVAGTLALAFYLERHPDPVYVMRMV